MLCEWLPLTGTGVSTRRWSPSETEAGIRFRRALIVVLVLAILGSLSVTALTPGRVSAVRATIERSSSPEDGVYERAYERNRALEWAFGSKRTWVPCTQAEFFSSVEENPIIVAMNGNRDILATTIELVFGEEPASDFSQEESREFVQHWFERPRMMRKSGLPGNFGPAIPDPPRTSQDRAVRKSSP